MLVGAAIEVIARDSWGGMTTRKVARRAGVNPGLVHYHFGAASALAREAALQAMGAAFEPVATVVSECDDLLEGLDLALQATLSLDPVTAHNGTGWIRHNQAIERTLPMDRVSHQTVRLAKGRHSSPQHGVGVMELASMLAGEAFSDRPSSVAPSIAAFLRAYNDMIDDERRQDLYAYAAKTVGTSGSWGEELARAELLVGWAAEMWNRAARWSITARLRRRRAPDVRSETPEAAAKYAIGAIRTLSTDVHTSVLNPVDELTAVGDRTMLGLELTDAEWTRPAGPADTQALVLSEGGDRFRS